MSKILTNSHSFALTRNLSFLSTILLLAAAAFACKPTTPTGASVQVKATNVDRAKVNADFLPLPAAAQEPLDIGDRLRLSQAGEALLNLPCALALLFGGSNIQMQEISLNGAN